MRTKLWVSCPDGVHGYGLQIYSEDQPHLVERFKELMYELFWNNKEYFGCFSQGGHGNPNWQYFEFFNAEATKVMDRIIALSESIAERLELELEIE